MEILIIAKPYISVVKIKHQYCAYANAKEIISILTFA